MTILTTADDVIDALDITDRAELIALLTPMRMPRGLSEQDKARVTAAVVAAAGRCWKGRTRVSG
jgi:hypothetical protein